MNGYTVAAVYGTITGAADGSSQAKLLSSVAVIIPAKSPVTVITAGFNHYARGHELALTAKIAINPKALLFNPPKTLPKPI